MPLRRQVGLFGTGPHQAKHVRPGLRTTSARTSPRCAEPNSASTGFSRAGGHSDPETSMAKARRSPKRNVKTAALALGAAGVSFAMTGGASATAPANLASQDNARRIFLGEEEIADISLATFHVFDRETESRLRQGIRVAAGCGGHGCGCRAASAAISARRRCRRVRSCRRSRAHAERRAGNSPRCVCARRGAWAHYGGRV